MALSNEEYSSVIKRLEEKGISFSLNPDYVLDQINDVIEGLPKSEQTVNKVVDEVEKILKSILDQCSEIISRLNREKVPLPQDLEEVLTLIRDTQKSLPESEQSIEGVVNAIKDALREK